jgi:hypothetical protein
MRCGEPDPAAVRTWGIPPLSTTDGGAMTTVDTHAWLQALLEDIATAPSIGTGSRYALLVGALAPLGAADAARQAVEIEKHAYWVRCGPHVAGADAAFTAAVDRAAYLADRSLRASPEPVKPGRGP